MGIQRKAFEAYMADRYKNTVDQRVCINSDGDYMAWDMQVAWHVWQAAKAQAVPEGFVLVEKTKLMQIIGSAAIIEPITRGNPLMSKYKTELDFILSTVRAMIEAAE